MNEALPGWLSALQEDTALSDELGIQWLDAESREELHQGAIGVLSGLGGNADWNGRGLDRIARCVPLAVGPERNKRLTQRASSSAIFFDPERPDHLSLSLAATMSPLTWAEAPATREGLRALLERYCFVEAQPVARLPRRFRTIASFGELDREQLEDALTAGHPMLDDATWYSGHADDPWLGVGELRGISLMAHLRDVRRENPQRFSSVSFRTLFSKSVITLELHPFKLWVVDIRYAPAPDAAGVRWVNEIFRSRFPEDVPADLIGSNALQGGHTALQEIEEQEARGGDPDNFMIAARAALAPGEPETSARFRALVERYAGDPDRLGFLANVAASWGDQGAVLEIAARTAGSELAEAILERLKPAVPQVNEGGDDEDEDEGEDEDDDLDEEDGYDGDDEEDQ